ncbi:MAG: hopanoid C-3 methylase HpnR [Planctomycetota bacterium]
MRVLLVHPSALMYAEIYLRLEPLGLECVAAALRRDGHDVRIVDLLVFDRRDLFRELDEFRPEVVAFSLNYLANIPEVVDLAKAVRAKRPEAFIFAGGHMASFVPEEVLGHGEGAIDCVVRGEGEETARRLVAACGDAGWERLPGVFSLRGSGPPAPLLKDLDLYRPARDLTRRRHKYFIGHLDPCASVEFSRGCPWDCTFCSAWTFYSGSYRQVSVDAIADDLASIREPHVFIVDDVAFVRRDHAMAIADAVERRRIRKEYYAETRADVFLKNHDVFRRWVKLGLVYMFLGIESLDEAGLAAFRKRTTPNKNFEALEVARQLGIEVAINIIANPAWDVKDFENLREWAMRVPEIVHLTVQTPYPGTELWQRGDFALTTDDYRLFDVQHAVVPTRLPLETFYAELVRTQSVLAKKHLGWNALKGALGIALKRLARGQTNFVRMLWKFSRVYNAKRQFGDHAQPVRYALRRPRAEPADEAGGEALYVHAAKGDKVAQD